MAAARPAFGGTPRLVVTNLFDILNLGFDAGAPGVFHHGVGNPNHLSLILACIERDSVFEHSLAFFDSLWLVRNLDRACPQR